MAEPEMPLHILVISFIKLAYAILLSVYFINVAGIEASDNNKEIRSVFMRKLYHPFSVSLIENISSLNV